MSRNRVVIENQRPRHGRNSGPVQGRLHRVSAQRAATAAGGHPACASLSKYVAAGGTAFAVLLISAVVPMGASPARADMGMDGYLRCIDSAGVTPRQHAEDWKPTISTIVWNLNNAESPAQVAQRLVASGINPKDAGAEVQCVMANIW